MNARRHYLDHNASAPLRPEVRDAVLDAMASVGNPSSVHAEGRRARAHLERARERVAALVGADPDRVVFTSGGTEANNAALRPGALVSPPWRGEPEGGTAPGRLLVGGTEHVSVLDGHGFARREILPVTADGRLDGDGLRAALAEGGPALAAVQVANSETGVLQPIAGIAASVRACGGVLHADAVQAAGRVPLDMAALGVASLALSGHKLGGLQGTGALVVQPGAAGPALPLLRGGAQEGRRRAGTENVAGIVGLGVAAECAARDLAGEQARLGALRDAAEGGLRGIAPDIVIFGAGADRLPNTLMFALPGLAAETALMGLDLAGVAVSSGSACSSGKVGRSHVLAAMGVDGAIAAGAIRVSLGWNSAGDDVAAFLHAFESMVRRLYERRAA